VIANRVIFLDRRGASPLPDEKVEGSEDSVVPEGVPEGVPELEPEDLSF
jgi:hypothetical protein